MINVDTPNLALNAKNNRKAYSETYFDRLFVYKIRKGLKKYSCPIYNCERVEH